ncbi:hypothetical protein LCGC14_0671100 [marine sediment metagenome]|uniref:Uncharacterized protein n=1 Tax=marine sediment metagenome TaxID=412755 RepID=A0A0F9QQV4_9ZZZZ
MADNSTNVGEAFKKDGFFIDVVAGDIVDTGTGPPTTIAIATSMWVPKGTVHNGTLLRAADDVGRRP